MGFLDDLGKGFGIGGDGVTTPEFSMIPGSYGVGGVRYEDGELKSSLDPKYQAIVDQLLGMRELSPEQQAFGTQATGAATGFLREAAATDPFDMAERQFARMEEILNPVREKERTSLEGRLLRQGRLGSTGGGETQGAFEEAIDQSRRQGLYDAFQQAQGVQRQQADLANLFGGIGRTTEQTNLDRMLAALGSATATEAMPLVNLQPWLLEMSESKRGIDAARAQEEASQGSFGEMLGSAGRSYLSSYLKPKGVTI